ncbi:MAG: sulfotransferase [Nocardioides sp.]|nr:sulfotransferase [Nocardioides sp.]
MSRAAGLLPPVSRRVGHRVNRALQGLRRGERELPTYVVAGVKRGGTTSLDEYLTAHPLVLRGLVEKGCRYFDVNYDRGPAWFRRHLPLSADVDRLEERLGTRPVLGESSPYYCFHPEAPARIAAELPAARLFLVLRDPVARAWSHYQYEVARGFEDLSPVDALAAEADRLALPDEQARWHAHRHFSYVARSRYAEQVARLHAHFDPSQLLVLASEDVFTRPADTVARALEHLGLPPHHLDRYPAHKPTPRNQPVPEEFAARVRAAVADDLATLPDLLPRTPLPAWSTAP